MVKLWTKEQVELLKALYPEAPPATIEHAIGRTMDSCRFKAAKLGIKRVITTNKHGVVYYTGERQPKDSEFLARRKRALAKAKYRRIPVKKIPTNERELVRLETIVKMIKPLK